MNCLCWESISNEIFLGRLFNYTSFLKTETWQEMMILSRQREWIIKVTYAKCPQAQEGLEDYIHRRTGISRLVQVQACLSLLFILTNRYYEKEAVTLNEILTPTTYFSFWKDCYVFISFIHPIICIITLIVLWPITNFWKQGYETINSNSFHIKSMQDQEKIKLDIFHSFKLTNIPSFDVLSFWNEDVRFQYLYRKVFWSVFWECAHDNIDILFIQYI